MHLDGNKIIESYSEDTKYILDVFKEMLGKINNNKNLCLIEYLYSRPRKLIQVIRRKIDYSLLCAYDHNGRNIFHHLVLQFNKIRIKNNTYRKLYTVLLSLLRNNKENIFKRYRKISCDIHNAYNLNNSVQNIECLNKIDRFGKTPLDMCIVNSYNISISRLLIKYGGKPSMTNIYSNQRYNSNEFERERNEFIVICRRYRIL